PRARPFDRIVGLLEERVFVHDGEVTADGRRLARIYAESDLLVAECLRQGLWRGLGPLINAAPPPVWVARGAFGSGVTAALGTLARSVRRFQV
ncbi:hypothetical protein, partial [Nocardia carnea]|uniref:hypothetical protein n=1 Tax=Nocardia carnea TaxID=37328 RepID=UPI002457890C